MHSIFKNYYTNIIHNLILINHYMIDMNFFNLNSRNIIHIKL